MKTNAIIFLTLLSTLILGSCSTSNEVVGGGIFQKRKYNDGVYWNRNSNLKESSAKNEKGLDIFKNEEKSSAKYVGSSSLYNESVNESENIATVENIEKINDVVNMELADDLNSDAVISNLSQKNIETAESENVSNQKEVLSKKSENKKAPVDDTVMLILLVVLAILIPPLAVFIYEKASTRFWIDLILAILGFGVGFWLLGGLGWLCGLAAIIYALLIVLEVI
ncbi:MAG: hypothetical protein RI883_1134 [Bacteroidota bacterium]|jgi:uncharacterized membrane protein YqaE (UPF0057 family)